MEEIFIRTEFNHNRDMFSLDCGFESELPSRAQQQFKDECDINTIVKNFGVTGMLPQNIRMPIEDDFVDIMDYHTAANALLAADESFMQLSAEVRKQFDNDPGQFVAFCLDQKNVDQLREWGLAVPAMQPSPPLEVVIKEPASGDGTVTT